MKMGKVNLTDILVRRYSPDVPKPSAKKVWFGQLGA